MRSVPQLDLEISRNESIALWGGYCVFTGLLIEFLLALGVTLLGLDNKIVEHWAAFVSTFLIASGVYAELHFGRKASEAQKELRGLSEKKVADATVDAAKALERAAALGKEASEARERTAEIERLTMPRRISPTQLERASTALREKTPDRIWISYHQFDIEATIYATELFILFVKSGAAMETLKKAENATVGTTKTLIFRGLESAARNFSEFPYTD